MLRPETADVDAGGSASLAGLPTSRPRNIGFAQLKRNALHMVGAQLTTSLLQGLQFVLIARALGADDFGRMAGVLAITSMLLPFSGMGAANVMVMRLARKEAAASLYFGNALMVAAVSGTLLVALAALFGPLFLRNSSLLGLVLLLGFSEVLMSKFIDIAAHVFYGLDQHALSGTFYCLQAASRLCSALLFTVFFADRGVQVWAFMHLASGLLVALIAFRMTVQRIGWPTFDVALARRELKVGVLFSIGLSANSVYTDIDKAVLARYENPQINGAYTAAYRLVFMAFTPVMAVLLATQGLFFRTGSESGVSATFKLATRVAWLGSAYCIALAALLYFASPLVTWALGAQYALSVEILRTLALLPLALMAQSVFSEALTGANRQRARSLAQVGIALTCFALNMMLVPQLGWHGAVMATYCCQIALAALVIALIWRSIRSPA